MKITFVFSSLLCAVFFISAVVPAEIQNDGSKLIVAARDGQLDAVQKLVRVGVQADSLD